MYTCIHRRIACAVHRNRPVRSQAEPIVLLYTSTYATQTREDYQSINNSKFHECIYNKGVCVCVCV